MKKWLLALTIGFCFGASFKLQDPCYQNNETLHYHIQKGTEAIDWIITINVSITSNTIYRTLSGNQSTKFELVILDKPSEFPSRHESWTKNNEGILLPESVSVWDLKQHTLCVKYGNQPWSEPSSFPAKNYLFSPNVAWDLSTCLPLSEHWFISIPSDFIKLTLHVKGIENVSVGNTSISCYKLTYIAEPHLAMIPLPRFDATYWIATGKFPRIIKAIVGTALGQSQIEMRHSSVLSFGSNP